MAVLPDDDLRYIGLAQPANDLASEAGRDADLMSEEALEVKVFYRRRSCGAHRGRVQRDELVPAPAGEGGRTTGPRGGNGVVLPNVGGLPWEEITAFREHPGGEEARGRLREIEKRTQQTGDPDSFDTRVAQEISDALFGTIAELKSSTAERLKKVGKRTAISFIPFVGRYLRTGSAAGEAVKQGREEKRTWTAALMELREGQTAE